MAMFDLYFRRADGQLGGPYTAEWISRPLTLTGPGLQASPPLYAPPGSFVSLTAPIPLPDPPKARKHQKGKKGKKHGRS